jgi:hypothetical protein
VEDAYRQGDTKFREGDDSGSERKGLEVKDDVLINLAGATKGA